ncbi:maleylpyruvate isomerase [Streptosporangium album]|uniref:Maleylpyruvate isomerase n=1 Tax=Streptosporangium album TaxID=47479 RepID=A0A7W7S121_9ACTN|nr:maleylpyruvate isomerase family mycothiol-dependent enzyme [Streptosporangium album]MBB4941810.1 maleylpyruvate isomerase [Streptosporangium album]
MADAWLEEGTALFTACLDAADLDAPSRLPGWTGRHLAAHVAYNAKALTRLVHWARTGEETPMYAGAEARDAEIEAGAALGPAVLRGLVAETAEELRSALEGLSDLQWRAQVVTAQGRTVPATEIPWMRVREVWVHAVDLGAGARFDDFPPDLVDALLTDVTQSRLRRGQEPSFTLAPHDRDRTWGADASGPHVTGPAARIAAWMTGRGEAPEASLPAPGRWL